MNERDRLIELIDRSGTLCTECPTYDCSLWSENLAEYLLANGVIVPPCKVGDKIYQTDGVRVYEDTINEITLTTHHMICDTENIAFNEQAIGRIVFLTREEAEQALKERTE